MPNNKKDFLFFSKALPDNTFQVVNFRGFEGLSKLYQYDITLASENNNIDLKTMIQTPVCLQIKYNEQYRQINGTLSHFYQLDKKKDHARYRAILVPRLWFCNRFYESQLFLDMKIPDIIQEILKQSGLTASRDFEIYTTQKYSTWEYICQYNETDFNFISRWMEREGLYYYFQQTEECEKLIITDNLQKHEPLQDEDTFRYSTRGQAGEKDTVYQFSCIQRPLPNKVILRDYNYRKPSVELKIETIVDPKGHGIVYIYGDHFKKPEQGKELAKIRSEELLASEKLFNGKSTSINFCPGYYFNLEKHFRDDYNQKYLLTEVKHEGKQISHLSDDTNSDKHIEEYSNRFVAIPSDVQYRPERKSPKSKFYGVIHARVDASSDGKYAEVDEEGRYKVKLPIDLSGRENGKASRWVRMAQPYSGVDYGMHFPLHKNTEVLLTFIDGDPDRPIISGALSNPDTPGPVTADNLTQSVIRTGSGNELHFDDAEGKENIYQYAKKDLTINVNNNKNQVIENDEVLTVNNNRNKTVKNSESINIYGNRNENIAGTQTETIKKDTSITISEGNYNHNIEKGTAEYYIKGNLTETYDGTQSTTVKDAVEIKSQSGHVKISAASNIQFIVGASSISMDSSGNITIKANNIKIEGLNITNSATAKHETKAAQINSSAGASNELTGATVSIKASSMNELKGTLVTVNGSAKVDIKGAIIGMNS